MALYQAGRLDLDVPVQKYCPAFPKKQWTITTRELLGHLSGIRHYKQDNSDVFSTKHYAHISDAFEVFADEPLLFEPGTKMQYTTFGYDVVGCVIEGASGEDFVSALNALVLGPAGMTSTRTDDAFVIIPHRSRPYSLAAGHFPVGLDVLEPQVIDSRCAAIGFAAGVSEPQYVLPVHLVVQSVETKVRRFLRFRV